MNSRQVLFIILISMCPMLLSFAIATLLTILLDSRMKDDRQLPRAFRAGVLILLIAGLMFTFAATPTLSQMLSYGLGIREGSRIITLLFGLIVIIAGGYVVIIMLAYRALLRALQQARIYRIATEAPDY